MRRVTVEKTTVMVQPQGALISHKFQDPTALQNSWILVIDPGGGTLDWYVARGRSPNWQRSGAYPKSMLACSYAVADRIDPTWRDNFEIIERIDKAIRDGDQYFTTAGNKYQMSDYSVTIDKVLEESTNKMVSKLGSLTNLDMIVVAGGGANVFAKYFGARYPNLKNIISVHSDPVYANVKGFHLVGELAADSAKR